MNQLQSAALMLAGAALVFAAILFAIWWTRRPRTAPAAPRVPPPPRAPGESRLPKLARTAKPAYEDVEIAPERLARIRRKTVPSLLDEDAPRSDPEPVADIEPETIDAALDSAAAQVEEEAQRAFDPVGTSLSKAPEIEEPVREMGDPEGSGAVDAAAGAVTLRLVPQIPPRDAILTTSWLGGRPRLPRGMEWPVIAGESAIFLAQVDCTELPRDLWQGSGPRDGSLAFFIHPRSTDMRVFHLRDTDVALAPSVPLDESAGWFGPYPADRSPDELACFAVRAFPEWPINLVAVRPGDADPRDADTTDAAGDGLFERGYDIADPAFHPFDWGSMTAMVALLEMRLDRLETGAAPVAGEEGAIAEAEHRAAINREARARAEEIIAIVHDSAARDAFAPGDATAVMSALHAIRWAKAAHSVDPETGAARVETITLPLTTHRPDADLWVHDYRAILFDRAKHAWCTNPNSLSAPARAFFEPRWRDLAAREMASMGGAPSLTADGHEAGHDAVLIDLPTSRLMSRRFGTGGHLVVTIDRAALAAGDFSAPRAAVID
ncbi:DUF1963 domain-containing protein [Sphingopyxis sp. JAI128]|uniref:DUF1963 domain-containing protein n=1 Tax=Sphingopyxis sp. JAI128 TaxID=2723066 RepID=UPI001620CDA0|nr:DUF1963 domain-containing protein [Sphingopyxis sp. JAI128]MBB6426743.1 hypothetical protein [Sphingopyxis sp. JAI128]